jgi:exodeoxyribonuclease VII large subunit
VSGHWYFTLKDDAAQVRCAMFRGRNALAGAPPRDGDAVEVMARVALYEPRGEYQLTIEALQAAGAGRLFELFVRLKARLAAEGIFDSALKRPLPLLPRAVGIVTSLQAAALGDVITALRRRAPFVRLIVYPTAVQGAGAGEGIAAMLRKVSARAEVDVVLLVRGGGSIEDLWPFNEEVVVRAIRASTLPIVVGVGHESDFTLADFAADLRAPTPTAAAELAAPEQSALLATVDERRQRLRRHARATMEARQQRLDYAQKAVVAPRAALAAPAAHIADAVSRLRAAMLARIAYLRLRRSEIVPGFVRLRPHTSGAQMRLRGAVAQLGAAPSEMLARRRKRCDALLQALSHLDPHAVLARGYSIVRSNENLILRRASDTGAGKHVAITFAAGTAKATIESTEL